MFQERKFVGGSMQVSEGLVEKLGKGTCMLCYLFHRNFFATSSYNFNSPVTFIFLVCESFEER